MLDKEELKSISKLLLAPIHRFVGIQMLGDKYIPPTGMVDLGSLRRTTPISRGFRDNEGKPIDRYYIENFIASHADDISGNVLEILKATYTRAFAGDLATKIDVLHVESGNPEATIIGDLTNASQIRDNTFDCFILPQALHCVYDIHTAVKTIYRILKPGGVVLATVPGVTQIDSTQSNDNFCWTFTKKSSRLLFEEAFPPENIQVETFGNVLSAIAHLEGMVCEELSQPELDYHDPLYQVTITIRAVKPVITP